MINFQGDMHVKHKSFRYFDTKYFWKNSYGVVANELSCNILVSKIKSARILRKFLKKLAITQTTVKDQQLTIVWKINIYKQKQ